MKDNKRPWFKFYPRDWLSDEKVRSVSFRARGVYMEILCLMWKSRTCKLPYDLKRLSRMVGMPQDEFIKIWDELMHPTARIFSVKKGKVQSDRLLLEKLELERIKKAKSGAAKLRWDKDLNKGASDLHMQKSNTGSACGLHMQNDAISDPDPDLDLSIDRSACADSLKKESRHYSAKVGDFLTTINNQCRTLDKMPKKNDQKFNPWQAVQMAVNENAHPEAIVTVQAGMIKQWSYIKKPMGYWTKSIKHNSAKFNERDHIKQSDEFKQAWNLDPRLKKMVQGIG